jgi:hypothetical protein
MKGPDIKCPNFELIQPTKVRNRHTWEVYKSDDDFLMAHIDNNCTCDITKCATYELFSTLLMKNIESKVK